MLKLPVNGQWTQPNISDKFGSIFASKNINLDESGYLKLAPRSVLLLDEAANADLGNAVAIGKYGSGEFQVATSADANFLVQFPTLAITEDSGTNEPTLTADSHGVFFHNYWLAATTDQVYRKAANGAANATWTSAAMTLTSAVKHALAVFQNRNSLCVANGNVVKQYTETGGTFTNTTDLTIPADFEVIGLAYNDNRMGVATTTGANSTGQLTETMFFLWDGSSTSATGGWGVGATKCLAVAPYKTSFVVLTNAGQLLFFNGGGFNELAHFPFFDTDKWLSDPTSTGVPMVVDGDKILINIGLRLSSYGRNRNTHIQNAPSGIWCYDPKVGLYHAYSASNSQAYRVTVAAAGTNTTTDIMTAATGTLPSTGNPVRYTDAGGTGITGLTVHQDYFIIKHDATTFSLATSKANANAGTKIDLTAQDSGTSTFHMYELVDYGATYGNYMAAIAFFGDTSTFYSDIIFGGEYPNISALTSASVLCYTVPNLENRGWFITPKVFSEEITNKHQKLFLKFRPLKSTDSIVVKIKDRNIVGLPALSPTFKTNSELIWTGTDDGYTSTDLSAAKTYFDAGGELEMEFVAGAGAGQTVKITALTESNGVYTLEFAEEVVGAASTRESYFIVDNWRTLGTITSDDNTAGFKAFNLDSSSKFVQFKTEMRGSDVAIEEMEIVSSVHKPSA